MELIVFIIAGAAGAYYLYRYRGGKVAAAMRAAERETKLLEPLEAQLGGHRISRIWTWVRDVQRGAGPGSSSVSMYSFRVTVHQVLPGWAGFHFDHRSGASDRSALFCEVFVGPSFRTAVPGQASLVGAGGDLSLESSEVVGQSGAITRGYTTAIVRLAREALAREASDWKVALLAAVGDSEAPGRLRVEALRVMLRRFPDSPECRAALEQAAGSTDPLLRIIIHRRRKDVTALTDLASDVGVSPDARVEAVRGLIDVEAFDILLTLAAAPPPGSELLLIEVLAGRDDPRVSSILASYVSSQSLEVVEAAADALARCGDPDALVPLIERLDRGGFPNQVRTALNVAIELIRDRAGVGGNRGALAVMPADDAEGGLSTPAGGELGLPREEPPE